MKSELLITFQPLKFLEMQNTYKPGLDSSEYDFSGILDILSFVPIWCFRLNSVYDYLVADLMSFASMPEVAIIFRADEYITISSIDWYNTFRGGSLKSESFGCKGLQGFQSLRYVDYLVPLIRKEDIVGIFVNLQDPIYCTSLEEAQYFATQDSFSSATQVQQNKIAFNSSPIAMNILSVLTSTPPYVYVAEATADTDAYVHKSLEMNKGASLLTVDDFDDWRRLASKVLRRAPGLHEFSDKNVIKRSMARAGAADSRASNMQGSPFAADKMSSQVPHTISRITLD